MTPPCPRCGLLHQQSTSCFSLTLSGPGTQPGLPVGLLVAARYRIELTIHRGGMSIVYLAYDVLQGRRVALKELRLPPGVGADEEREAEAWFARESSLLSMLQHPLIPAFYSAFREQNRSYIVQEYIEGQNLEVVLRSFGPPHQRTVIAWGRALCDLLNYLHSLPVPVVFRDLKPANVLLRAGRRQLAVVDFGIARPYQQGEVGTVIGTPGYAPPEQYQGLAMPQSDLYALGATLYFLLTGYNPEHGPPFSFIPLRQRNPQVSPRLEAEVERALRLNPAERQATAAEFGAALEASAAQPALHVQQAVAPVRYWLPWIQAWPLFTVLVALPLLVFFSLSIL